MFGQLSLTEIVFTQPNFVSASTANQLPLCKKRVEVPEAIALTCGDKPQRKTGQKKLL